MTEAATVPGTGLKKWEQTDPELKSNCTENNQGDAAQMTDVKMTVRAVCAVLHVAAPPPSAHLKTPLLKVLPTDQQWGIGLWTQVCLLPWLPASGIKRTFLSTNTCLSSTGF